MFFAGILLRIITYKFRNFNYQAFLDDKRKSKERNIFDFTKILDFFFKIRYSISCV